MKLLYDFFPIIIFFVVFKIWGIYAATASAIVVSLLQVIFYYLKHKKFERMQVITLILIVVLGGATLIFHNDMFIKWKVSIINWLFALAFLGSQFIGKKNFVKRMLDEKIQLPERVWTRLNLSWVIYFLVLGIANIYVVYHFSTNAWVNFKLFGVLGLTLIFVIIQGVYLAKHIKHDQQNR
jgi:intracellular septation protein